MTKAVEGVNRIERVTYPRRDIFEVFASVINRFASRKKLKEHHSVTVDVTLHKEMSCHCVLRSDIAAINRLKPR